MWKTNSGKSSCLSPINCMGEKVFPSFAFLSKSRNQKVLKFGGDRSEFSRRENFLPDDFNQNNMTHKTEPHSRTLGNGVWKSSGKSSNMLSLSDKPTPPHAEGFCLQGDREWESEWFSDMHKKIPRFDLRCWGGTVFFFPARRVSQSR